LPNDFLLDDVQAARNLTVIGNRWPFAASPVPGAERPVERDPTGEIRGRVVRSDGRPLAHAQVRLELADPFRNGSSTLADDDGRYEFTDLPPGDYTVKASRRGYLDAEYGQTRAFEHGAEIAVGRSET
jgi:hypothetical protein